VAQLSLTEGEWLIGADLPGIWPVKRHLRVERKSSYVIKMYTSVRNVEPITVVNARRPTRHSTRRAAVARPRRFRASCFADGNAISLVVP
jgi:hypothetical protein